MNGLLLTLFYLAASTLGGAASLSAADAGKRYLKLKDDGDLFVGEGVAELKEFKDEGLKALEAARERARAALASSIQVRITSETSEELKNGKEGSSEEISSKSKSLSDLVLENVHNEDFVDFPEKGRITALAYVTKEDYRRQLAGKATPVYRPQYGLKLAVWGLSLPSLDKMENSGPMNAAPTDAPISGGNGGGMGGSGGGNNGGSKTGGGIPMGFGLEFVWADYSLGLDFYRKEMSLYVYDDILNQYEVRTDGVTFGMLSLGWQYIPWNWRVQPFFPLGLHVSNASWMQHQALLAAASAGAGLRYWPSDSFSLEICVRYLQGLNSSKFTGNGFLYIRKGQEAELSLTGAQVRVAMQWSGF